jgi:hypothetical protein
VGQTTKRYHIRRRREAPAARPCQAKTIEKTFFDLDAYGFQLGRAALRHPPARRYRRGDI